MFKLRSNQAELLDKPTNLVEADLIENLKEFEPINRWLGSVGTVKNAFKKISNRYNLGKNVFLSKKITVADLGCGGGDLLRAMDGWCKDLLNNYHLYGIDNNPTTVGYAISKSLKYSNMSFITEDILSKGFQERQFDIITLNNCCHH